MTGRHWRWGCNWSAPSGRLSGAIAAHTKIQRSPSELWALGSGLRFEETARQSHGKHCCGDAVGEEGNPLAVRLAGL